ncbi:MAG: HEAT repeat domain-containing protein [Myxococcota bacterium]
MRAIRLGVVVGMLTVLLPMVAHAQGISPRLQKQLEEEKRRAEEEEAARKAAEAAAVPQKPYPGLSSEDASVRLLEASRLGRIRDPAAAEALLAVLVEDPDPEVRARAAWALGRIRHEPAVPQLAAALAGDSSRRVRRAAALALGDIGTMDARKALVARVQDEDSRVAAAAIEGLGRTGSAEVRAPLLDAARDPRALVSLTAKRTLATLPKPAPATTARVPLADVCGRMRPDVLWWTQPQDCTWRRDVSDGAWGDPFLVLTGAVLGGAGGALALDAVRPGRTGVRVTPKRSTVADNSAAPLERAILGAIGGSMGAGTALAWTLIDDVTMSRAGLIAFLAAQGVGTGAGLALSMSMPRNAAVGTMLLTGTFATVAATLVTWVPGDFSYGDVAWVWTSAALGAGLGTLAMLTVIPSRVGRQRGREGYVHDLGADLFPGLISESPFVLPWGEVGRLELALGAGLLTSGVTTLLSVATIPFYEVGITRALATLGAAMLGAMATSALVAAPAFLLGDPPAPPGSGGAPPTPERVGTGLAILGGAAAGAVAFALWPNDPGQGPLVVFERPRSSRSARARRPQGPLTLTPPTVAVMPPLPALGSEGPSGAGVYVGLINARY